MWQQTRNVEKNYHLKWIRYIIASILFVLGIAGGYFNDSCFIYFHCVCVMLYCVVGAFDFILGTQVMLPLI